MNFTRVLHHHPWFAAIVASSLLITACGKSSAPTTATTTFEVNWMTRPLRLVIDVPHVTSD